VDGYAATRGGRECRKRQVGDTCFRDLDCSTVINGSQCRQGICLCLIGYKQDDVTLPCTPRTLGDSCTTHEDCQVGDVAFNSNQSFNPSVFQSIKILTARVMKV
jgi:hypothetical protein